MKKKKSKILKKASAKSKTTRKKITAKRLTSASTAAKKPLINISSELKQINPVNPGHAAGHRKMNIVSNFSEKSGSKVRLQESAVNNAANGDKVRKIHSNNRRIVSGAAIGKTGRITYK